MFKKLTVPQVAGIVAAAVAAVLLVGSGVLLLMTRSAAPETAAKEIAAVSAAAAPSSAGISRPSDTTAPAATAAPSAAAAQTQPASSTAASAPGTSINAAPAALSTLLEQGGYRESTLRDYGAHQLIVVHSSGTTAEITFFEDTDSGWQQNESLTCQGYVGENGTTAAMSEQTAATPQGLYPVGSAFYQDDAPETGLDTFAITSDTYWVDDPDSAYYNQRVVGEDDKDWNSAEKMAEIPSYRYGFVIRYNDPPVGYGRGSAIFFHVNHDSPTKGCVTADEDMVLAYLAQLDASKHPFILIL